MTDKAERKRLLKKSFNARKGTDCRSIRNTPLMCKSNTEQNDVIDLCNFPANVILQLLMY